MLLTPTYHVFDMFQVHQDATLLPVDIEAGEYGFEDQAMPKLSASASRDKADRLHLSLCNTDPHGSAEIACEIRGATAGSATGRVLTATGMTAHNTFDSPDAVAPSELSVQIAQGALRTTLPPMSVAVLEVSL